MSLRTWWKAWGGLAQRLLALVGSVASVVGLLIAFLPEKLPWWAIVSLVFGAGCVIVLVVLDVSASRGRRVFAKGDIGNIREYMHEWIDQGGRVAVWTRDMSWAQNVITGPLIDDFMGYEVQATRYARAYPQVAICLYDLDKFRGNVIIPVLKVHPKVFFGGMLLENPYYVDPDDV